MRHARKFVRASLALLFGFALLPVAHAQVNAPAASPTLDARGARVAFLMNVTGTAQVWSVAATGGWPEQLTFYTHMK